MVNDVSRAFFEADASRTVCIELPPESPDFAPGVVGLLKKSLYGTRDAAANFQLEVARFMSKTGFARSRYNPCLFYHPGRQVPCLVHGDGHVVKKRAGKALYHQVTACWSGT